MIKAVNKTRDPKPNGRRYSQKDWEPVVREMWERGAYYGEIAERLGVSETSVCRWCWQLGLSNWKVHRNTTRTAQRKAALITPEVMHYQSIVVQKGGRK